MPELKDHEFGLMPETAPSPVGEQTGEITFGEIFRTLSSRRTTIGLSALCTAVTAIAIAFLIPPEYVAESVILTPQQPDSSFSSMAQAGSAGGGLAGLSLLSAFGLRNPSDLYVGILESRTIADALIAKFHLQTAYNDKFLQRARKRLERNTSIKAGKDTLIHIKVSDRDPKRAAQLANAYVEELATRDSSVALTEASRRRMFFESQLVKQKDLLADAEIALRNTQQSTGLLVPAGQAEALIRSTSQLEAEIVSKQAQLAGMRSFVAEENPRYRATEQEVASLQSKLSALEKGSSADAELGLPVTKLPQAGLEYLRKYRDVKYHETLFEALARQFEAARLDEAKAGPIVQVVDSAVVPEKRSWPPRTLIVLGSTLMAALLSSLWILLRSQ